MAASVIRTLSALGLAGPGAAEDEPNEDDEDDCDEPREDGEDDDSYFGHTETTERLLRFAELISGDVQRYFGRGRDPDACDVYAGSHSGAASAQRDEPGKKLGPLAELFQEAPAKKQGLPMIERRLPRSFWTEPGPEGTSGPEVLGCCLETTNANPIPVAGSSTPDFSDLLEHWASERDHPTDFTCDYQLP